MGQALSLPFKIIKYTTIFYGGLAHYLLGAGRTSPYLTGSASTFPYLRADVSDTKEQALFKQHTRVHLFSMASAFYLYDKPHYRKGSYKDDLVDNLRNVAIPGTGIPLSIFVRSKYIALSGLTNSGVSMPWPNFLCKTESRTKSAIWSSLADPRSNSRTSHSTVEKRQFRTCPSAVNRRRLQSPQNECVTGLMKPTRSGKSAYS